MSSTNNPNTRAIVSALRCDHKTLRAAAAQLVDKAMKGQNNPKLAVMLAFDCSLPTARSILKARDSVTRGGARR